MSDPLPSATVYHVDNLILHMLGTCMLFLALYRGTRRRWPSFIVALLWAIHPLRVESVVWVTERKDVLAGLFGFLAIYLYFAWVDRRRGVLFTGVMVAFLLSLLCKAMFVSLPLLLLILDFWPLNRIASKQDFWRAVLEKWPLFVLTFLSAVATSITSIPNGTLDISRLEKTGNAFLNYVRYLWMHFSFLDLVVFHPYVRTDALLVVGAILLLAAITALVIRNRKSRPWLLAGWLFFVVAFIPMVGFVQSFIQAYADRFSYLPSIGLFIIAAFSIPASWFDRPSRLAGVLAATFAMAILLGVFTFRQAGYWRDSVTLFTRAHDLVPINSFSQDCLARSYVRQHDLDNAEIAYRESATANPKNTVALLGLAWINMKREHPELALPFAKRATEIDPWSGPAHSSYGLALAGVGQLEEAVWELERASDLLGHNAVAENNVKLAKKMLDDRKYSETQGK